MEILWQDLRYGFRMLLKNPGVSAVVIIALALGIGANSAIFSVVNAILLRPLGYHDPDRLVLINHNYPKLDLKASVSAVGYTHYRNVNHSFENMMALSPWPANLTEAGEPERLEGLSVTATFFSTLGVEAARGRLFLPEDDQPGRNRVVVVSDGLWRRRFAADPNFVGKTVTINGEGHTVVGITPAGFQFGRELGQAVDLWRPIAFTTDQLQTNRWRNEFLVVFARLKPKVTVQQAQAEMDTIAANVRRQYFGEGDAADPSRWGLLVRPLYELIVGDIRPALLVLLAAVGCVLLIACANVTNLLLARAATRQKEIAIRTAIGAGRARVIRQLLTESTLLAIVGGGLGLLLGYWGVKLLVALNRANIPRAHEISLDLSVLGFTLGLSLLTGLIFGLAPALQTSKTDLQETLKEGGGHGTTGGARHRLRSLLVVAEVALALVLLIGAGLLVKSFLRLQQVDPGFRFQNLLVMQLSLPGFKYREENQIDNFYREMLERIRALPEVESAGVASTVPMTGSGASGSFSIEGRVVAPGQMMPWGNRWLAGATHFKTMGIPLVKGRYFDERDVSNAPPVAIIDETMARKYWPGEDPVGKRISFQRDRQGKPIWREVVGVVGHVKQRGLEGESPVQYYLPHRQFPSPGMFLAVRTASSNPTSLAPSVRGVIQSLDPSLPVFRVTTMERLVSDSMAQRRFAMVLLGIFAACALVLAAVGLYGVMSYSVTQRTHEIGIRMALGARPRDVLRMIVVQGIVLAIIGLAIGLGAAFGLTRWMTTLLFGVRATDPAIYAGISLILPTVAAVASYIPARRAMKVDPIVALRYE